MCSKRRWQVGDRRGNLSSPTVLAAPCCTGHAALCTSTRLCLKDVADWRCFCRGMQSMQWQRRSGCWQAGALPTAICKGFRPGSPSCPPNPGRDDRSPEGGDPCMGQLRVVCALSDSCISMFAIELWNLVPMMRVSKWWGSRRLFSPGLSALPLPL